MGMCYCGDLFVMCWNLAVMLCNVLVYLDFASLLSTR